MTCARMFCCSHLLSSTPQGFLLELSQLHLHSQLSSIFLSFLHFFLFCWAYVNLYVLVESLTSIKINFLFLFKLFRAKCPILTHKHFSPVSEERRMCVFFCAGHPGLKNEGAFTRVLLGYVNPFFTVGDLLNPM